MKVYVIGSGYSKDDVLKSIPELPEGTEFILVNSVEDIPIEDRFKSNIAVHEIHTLKCPPPMPDMSHLIHYDDYGKKRKGHERPYKYHK